MSTTADFENAPVGATATLPDWGIAFKTGRRKFEWSVYDLHGTHLDNRSSDGMFGYTLNPAVPTTAREALDLAWELAHPVKAGQTIPPRTECIQNEGDGFGRVTTPGNWTPVFPEYIRTLDPLPEPDWLNAPAVLAGCPDCDTDKPEFWIPNGDDTWTCIGACLTTRKWWELKDVTPLYPKEQGAVPADIPDDPLKRRAYLFHYGKPWGSELGGEPV